ncbi:Hypothetical predicted protein [Cloeon dipterum]|uniref:Major facilitator superfamily (MFS) profile domain-containing protein n=2 Tax=Cloeon dipterum TaxID=197152 RepID=A0A8S1C2H4_9INSE|nr:Hypothetical predicted protein [Cloeon dipterum]
MLSGLSRKLYKPWVLLIVTAGYIVGELGHYLIGVTSRATARDLHYGDKACQLNVSSGIGHGESPVACGSVLNQTECAKLHMNGTFYCEWDYNGLGLEYQILAGPSYIAVFTVAGILLGVAADRYNRVTMLGACTLIFSVATILMGAVNHYWELTLLRMVLAFGEAGCNPMAAGILSDLFAEEYRALVMSIFNWGIYGGYGIAFPVGRYVTAANIWGLGWRLSYYAGGVVGLVLALLTYTTLRDPQRQAIGEERNNANGEKITLWQVVSQPRMVLLCLAASIRHMGGLCFAYNCDLYYQTYFPEVDLGWWLFAVTICIGSIGVVAGGVLSDKIVATMGVKSRLAVLALSQLIASPLAFGSVYFEPTGAMISLACSYIFAEMWFGILFAILVEIVPLAVRSTTLGVFLFFMNNIGGNLPVLVEPLSKAIGYRESLWVFYVGAYFLSSILFFFTMFLMEQQPVAKPALEAPPMRPKGVDNTAFEAESSRL